MTSSQLQRSVEASSETLCIRGVSPRATSDVTEAFILTNSGKNRKVLRSLTLLNWSQENGLAQRYLEQLTFKTLVSNDDRNPTTFIEVRRSFPQYLTNRFHFYYVGGTLQSQFLFHKASIVENFDTCERAYTHKHTYVHM